MDYNQLNNAAFNKRPRFNANARDGDDFGGGGRGGGGRGSAHGQGQWQGLTLVHFSAQLERFVWDSGCAQGWCSPC